MQAPDHPADEAERLATLHALRLLDTEAEGRFDRVTRVARTLFDVPIALVSLVDADRQWFKSRQGLDATETPRELSFCGHAILGDDLFMVSDAPNDARFADNPLVTGAPNIRFYAGRPLKAANGHNLGTLCLIDRKPRALDRREQALLDDLAGMAENEIDALHQATTDDLTGLSNRRGCIVLGQHLLDAYRSRGLGALALGFRLEDMHLVAKRYGAAEVDAATARFAGILSAAAVDIDLLARTRHDTFTALLPQPSVGVGQALARRLHQALDRANDSYDAPYRLRCTDLRAAVAADGTAPVASLLDALEAPTTSR